MRVARLRWLKVRIFTTGSPVNEQQISGGGGGRSLASDGSAPSSKFETTGGRGRRSFARRSAAGLLATALVTGSFVGLSATVASAATTSFTMNMTAGQFGVRGNPPATLPPPGSFAGTESSTTGEIAGATLSLSSYHTTNTGSTETIFITQATAGAATGMLSYTGTLTLTDTLSVLITIHVPAVEQCLSTPIHVNLTGHYDSATKVATVSETNFTIPNFPATSPAGTCGLAGPTLDTRFAGSTGNVMSLSLQGTLHLPPPPRTPTVTTLSATPPSSALAGTPVTFHAVVASGGQTATTATGTVKIMSGSTQIGSTQSLATGEATVTTSNVPAVAGQQFTAVYSGDGTYAGSTSAPLAYAVQPRPTVAISTRELSVTRGALPTTFSVLLTNPSTGENWSSLQLHLRLLGISALRATQMTLAYENPAQVWCPITLSGYYTITGTFKGTSGTCSSASSFSLAPGHSLTVPFEVSYTATANVGIQTFVATLRTVSGTMVVPPFTAATVTTVPTNAPYAKGTVTVIPTTKYTVTVNATPPSTATPKGYLVPVYPTLIRPATTTTATLFFPTPTGTVTFLVDGHVVSTVGANSLAFADEKLATATLSVGRHTLEVKYDGNSIYNGVQITKTFTVTTAAPGTAFVCSSANHSSITASVVASGALPASSNTGQAALSGLQVTLHTDPTTGPITAHPLTTVSIALSPGGSVTASNVTPTNSGGVITSSWSGLSGTVTGISGVPGTVVPVSLSSLSFLQGGFRYSCVPSSTSAPLGSVTVSGVTLSASPASPVVNGTTVTLTARVFPANLGGQVNFLDGSTNVGTAAVSNGTAQLVLASPTLGAHAYQASWAATVPVSTSNVFAYTIVTAPAVTTQPQPQTVNAGQSASFSAAASGTPAPTVQWQVSSNGSTWTAVIGATGTTYATPATTAADNGHQYRAVFTNVAGTATTDAASLVVVSPPNVVTQPANQSVQTGNSATFSAKATGSVLAVQWQVSTNGGSSWSNATGTPKNSLASATTLTSAYTTPATATTNNGNQYRAHFSNGAGTANSNAATLTVTTTPPPPAAPPAAGHQRWLPPGGFQRLGLQLRQRPLLRLDGRPDAQQADRGDGHHAR